MLTSNMQVFETWDDFLEKGKEKKKSSLLMRDTGDTI